VRIVIWVIPLIFMAGTLYISIQTTMARQEAQEERLRQVSDRVTTMASDQRVLQEHIAALRTAGDRIQPQFDELREQLIALRTDIAAIREKLGIAASRSR
jgi:predicted  nucleic acid-binding Zn-ribbon protein